MDEEFYSTTSQLLSETLEAHADIGRESLRFQTSHAAVQALKGLEDLTGLNGANF